MQIQSYVVGDLTTHRSSFLHGFLAHGSMLIKNFLLLIFHFSLSAYNFEVSLCNVKVIAYNDKALACNIEASTYNEDNTL